MPAWNQLEGEEGSYSHHIQVNLQTVTITGQLKAEVGPEREDIIRPYVRQMLLSLQMLHEHGIVHRDISLENMVCIIEVHLTSCSWETCNRAIPPLLYCISGWGDTPEYIKKVYIILICILRWGQGHL